MSVSWFCQAYVPPSGTGKLRVWAPSAVVCLHFAFSDHFVLFVLFGFYLASPSARPCRLPCRGVSSLPRCWLVRPGFGICCLGSESAGGACLGVKPLLSGACSRFLLPFAAVPVIPAAVLAIVLLFRAFLVLTGSPQPALAGSTPWPGCLVVDQAVLALSSESLYQTGFLEYWVWKTGRYRAGQECQTARCLQRFTACSSSCSWRPDRR